MSDVTAEKLAAALVEAFITERRVAVEEAVAEQAFDRAKNELAAVRARLRVAEMDRGQAHTNLVQFTRRAEASR